MSTQANAGVFDGLPDFDRQLAGLDDDVVELGGAGQQARRRGKGANGERAARSGAGLDTARANRHISRIIEKIRDEGSAFADEGVAGQAMSKAAAQKNASLAAIRRKLAAAPAGEAAAQRQARARTADAPAQPGVATTPLAAGAATAKTAATGVTWRMQPVLLYTCISLLLVTLCGLYFLYTQMSRQAQRIEQVVQQAPARSIEDERVAALQARIQHMDQALNTLAGRLREAPAPGVALSQAVQGALQDWLKKTRNSALSSTPDHAGRINTGNIHTGKIRTGKTHAGKKEARKTQPVKASAGETRPAQQAAGGQTRRDANAAPKKQAARREAGSGFVINLASFSQRDSAERQKQSLRAKGYRARVKAVQVRGKTLYRLIINGFASRETAAAKAGQIRRRLGMKAWVQAES